MVLCGTCFFAYFIGAINSLVAEGDMVRNEKIRRIEQAQAFCFAKRLSPKLTKVILSHTKYHWDQNYVFDDDIGLLESLPIRIRFEIGRQISNKFLSTCPIFDDLDAYVKGLIALKLKSICCNENIKLFKVHLYLCIRIVNIYILIYV